MGQLFDDDISIPPPREIKQYYCSSCGAPGGTPDPGATLATGGLYVVGKCPCTKPTRRLGKSYGGSVQLVADIVWDQRKFEKRQLEKKMRAAWQKQQNGGSLNPEETALAGRWRVRLGLPNDNG